MASWMQKTHATLIQNSARVAKNLECTILIPEPRINGDHRRPVRTLYVKRAGAPAIEVFLPPEACLYGTYEGLRSIVRKALSPEKAPPSTPGRTRVAIVRRPREERPTAAAYAT